MQGDYITVPVELPTCRIRAKSPGWWAAGWISTAGVPTHQPTGADQLQKVLLQERAPHQRRHHHSQQHRLLQGYYGPGALPPIMPTCRALALSQGQLDRHSPACTQRGRQPASLLLLMMCPEHACSCCRAAAGKCKLDFLIGLTLQACHGNLLQFHAYLYFDWRSPSLPLPISPPQTRGGYLLPEPLHFDLTLEHVLLRRPLISVRALALDFTLDRVLAHRA